MGQSCLRRAAESTRSGEATVGHLIRPRVPPIFGEWKFSPNVARLQPSATIAVSSLARRLRAEGRDIIDLSARRAGLRYSGVDG